jgi:hypothetical protein
LIFRPFEQYHTSSNRYQVDNHQPAYTVTRSMSPTGPPTSYKHPSNYANLQSMQNVYSSSGPSPQTGPTPQSDSTIYARPVKVVREPPDNYNPPRDPVAPPAGYVRQNVAEHRLFNNQESPDFNYGRPASSSSGGFVPRYEVILGGCEKK